MLPYSVSRARRFQTRLAGSLILLSGTAVLAADGPDLADIRLELARINLTPIALAAVGCNEIQTSAVVDAAIQEMAVHWDQTVSLTSELDGMLSQRVQLKHALASGRLNPNEHAAAVAEIEALDIQIAIATNALQQIHATTRDAFLAAMPASLRTSYQQVQSEIPVSVPLEYRVLDLSDAQWVELRHALAIVRTNEEPPADAIQLLSGYDANYEVNLIRVRLETSLPAITAVFEQALEF